MKKVILCILFSLTPFSYGANYQGKMTNVFAYNGNIYVLIRNGNFDNSSGNCSTRADAMPAYINIESEYGKSLLSNVLIAKTTEKLVWVSTSSNTCKTDPYGSTGELVNIDLKG